MVREAIDITTENICGLLIYCQNPFFQCPPERGGLSIRSFQPVREKSVVDEEIKVKR